MALRLLNHHFGADRLPTELWNQVFGELPYTEMLRCQLLSRRFRTIIRSMLEVYRVWLRALALVNVETSQIPLNERKRMLLRYHRAWEKLSPNGPLPPQGRFYCPISTHLPHAQPPPLILESGWVVLSDYKQGLVFTKLPTISSVDIPPFHNGWFFKKQLTRSQLPHAISYRFDPSQDLLVFLGMSAPQRHPDLFVLSMSTGRPHPLAKEPIFDAGIGPMEEINSFRVHKDLVAILAGADHERVLQVWNWKTGVVLLTEENFDAWGDLVTFVGDRTLLLVQEYSLHLFVFTDDDEVHSCDLKLPRFHPHETQQLWTTVSQPFNNAPEPGRAFTTDPDHELVVINMVRGVESGPRRSLLLAIRLCGLLEQVRRLLERAGDLEDACVVEWAEWGPQSSRFVVAPETWEAPSTFGRRCVLSYYNAQRAPELALFDFGVGTEKVTMGATTYETSPEWAVSVLPAPVGMDMRLYFEDVTWVETQLPFRMRRKVVRGPPSQKLIGATLWEDGIILQSSFKQQCDYVSMPLYVPPVRTPNPFPSWPPLPPPHPPPAPAPFTGPSGS